MAHPPVQLAGERDRGRAAALVARYQRDTGVELDLEESRWPTAIRLLFAADTVGGRDWAQLVRSRGIDAPSPLPDPV